MKGNAQTLGDCSMSCSWYKCSLRERRLFPVEIGGNWKYVFVGRIRMEFPCPVFWAWVKKDFSCAVAGLGRSSRVNFFFYIAGQGSWLRPKVVDLMSTPINPTARKKNTSGTQSN